MKKTPVYAFTVYNNPVCIQNHQIQSWYILTKGTVNKKDWIHWWIHDGKSACSDHLITLTNKPLLCWTPSVWSNTNPNWQRCNDAMARKFLLTSCILDNSHKSAQHIPTVTSTSLHDDPTFCSKKSTSLPSKPWSGRSIHMHFYVVQSSNPPFPAISTKKKTPNTAINSWSPPQNLPSPWQSLGNVSWPGREWLFFGGRNFESSIISYVVSQYFWSNKNIQKLYG